MGGTPQGAIQGPQGPRRGGRSPARPSDFGDWELGLPLLFLRQWEPLPFTPCSSEAWSGCPERGIPRALCPGVLTPPLRSQERGTLLRWADPDPQLKVMLAPGAGVCALLPLRWGKGTGRAHIPMEGGFHCPVFLLWLLFGGEKCKKCTEREGQPWPVPAGPLVFLLLSGEAETPPADPQALRRPRTQIWNSCPEL